MASPSELAVSREQSRNALSKKQSLALVKIFLNASIACICHTRELINWQSSCFRKRYSGQISLDTDDVYHNFCALESTPPDNSQEVRVLVRGSNRKADAILDMIECGVFGAIESTYLDILQIFVTTQSGDTKTIQETYTYSFTYLDNAVASIELKEQQQFLSLVDAQRSFKAAIRNLLRGMKDLPSLPENCSLGMSMAYNDNCPAEYEPSGFIGSSNHPVLPEDWSRLWDQKGETVCTFDAANHNVSIAARNSTFGYQTASQIKDTIVSKQLQNLQKTSSGRHPGLVSTLPLPISPQYPAPVTRMQSTPNQGDSARLTRSASQRSRNGQQGSLERSKRTLTADLESSKPIPNPLRGLTIQSRFRRKRNILPEKIAKAIVQAHCLDFEAEDGQTIFDSVQLDRGIIYRIDQSNTVRCECGSDKHSDLLLYCHLCNSWQHSQCYGMSLLKPRSLPDQHLCYSCLLLPEEEEKLGNMVDNVHMRLALTYISQLDTDTLDANKDFFRAVLGPQGSTVLEGKLLERLTVEGVISQLADGSLKILKAGEESLNRFQTDYLDPLANIGHLYQIAPSKGNSQTDLREQLRKYTGGRDYKFGQGVHDRLVQNSFGEQVVWWGYFDDRPGSKRKTSMARMGIQDEPSPRRRKISISRAFIALDRSTPLDENDFRRDAVSTNLDSESLPSHASSTVSDF